MGGSACRNKPKLYPVRLVVEVDPGQFRYEAEWMRAQSRYSPAGDTEGDIRAIVVVNDPRSLGLEPGDVVLALCTGIHDSQGVPVYKLDTRPRTREQGKAGALAA